MRQRLMRRVAFVLALVACHRGAPHTSSVGQPSGKPLYDRIGGMDAIRSLVKEFVEDTLVHDVRLSGRFIHSDLAQLEDSLSIQLCEVSGGPCKYTGRSMSEAHAGKGIDEADWTAFLEDLRQTLAKRTVATREQKELLDLLARWHHEIVE